MDIIGKWKIKEFHIPTTDGLQIFAPDTLPEDEAYTDYAQMARTLTEFTADGRMDTLKDCPDALRREIPNELLADHYSNTLFLVWQWSAVKHADCSKEMAHAYLKKLLTLE